TANNYLKQAWNDIKNEYEKKKKKNKGILSHYIQIESPRV
ncbi:hypothetical protein EC970007_1195, partial [Escherichia coli 97.0007]